MDINNPKVFWNHIKTLGPNIKKDIRLQIYDERSGSLNCDIDIVLAKWKNDFSNSLNNNDQQNFDNHFLMLKNHEKNISEQSENNIHVHADQNFNSNISLVEAQRELDRFENNKAVGRDYISNKLMKSGNIAEWLHTLFSFCFAQIILPSAWHKAFITPIPKSADKDASVPLNYRGISLLSCVSKVCTGILNCVISQYCENNGLINEEQNGFRRGRALLNTHIYFPV